LDIGILDAVTRGIPIKTPLMERVMRNEGTVVELGNRENEEELQRWVKGRERREEVLVVGREV
jgi:hypothetical protein